MDNNKKELTAKTQYDLEYAKNKIKRVPLDMQKDEYEKVKAAAESVGEKVNTYIKKAIRQRMEQERSMGDSFHIQSAEKNTVE